MRPLEILLVCLIVGAALCSFFVRWARTGRAILAGALIAGVAHGILEGAHWQMIPAYAAAAILGLVFLKPGGSHSRLRKIAASAALAFAAASVSFSILLPIFCLPKPTGPYPVGTSILYLKDATRIEDAAPGGNSARELAVQLWYPAQPSHNRLARYREPRETDLLSSYQSAVATNSRMDAPVARVGGPFPIVLFNHAWRGRRTNDTFLTEELASRGYVVASIDHTYNARLVAFPDGRVAHGIAANDVDDPEIGTPESVRADWNKELRKWVADQRFVLDRLEEMNRTAGSRWFGSLNIAAVGAMGHSFGGAAATAVCAADTRVRASLNMDGWFFDAIRARGPRQPLLFMDAYTDRIGETPGPSAKVETTLDETDFDDVEGSLRRFGGYLLSVKGASHEDFTDQPLISPLRALSRRGTIPVRRIQEIVRTYVDAFFDKTLRGGNPEILRAPTSPYAEIRLDAWPPN
jgi:dienelactone hydrolase